MERTGLVPLFTHADVDDALHVLEVSYKAGVRAFEFTNRRKNSFEVFCALRERSKTLEGLLLGIGTVMDTTTTEKYIDAGADFIISPVMIEEMGSVCMRHDVPWIPGCATLTEIVTAREHGAQLIKLFPGSVLGPGFVSAVLPVIPELKLMITGGVEPHETSLSSWFRAGACCVGMGSHLFTTEILQARDWVGLQNRIHEVLTLINYIRKQDLVRR
jgi:2-dehydro-3-deoxyphosphogluconate aldolase/(4S)-4-hydroxy-2-oxoglutarate aldolase